MTYYSKRGIVKTYPKTQNKVLPVALGTGLMVAAGSSYAGISTDASAAISAGSADLQTVGIAIIAVVAGVWVIKRVIALIR